MDSKNVWKRHFGSFHEAYMELDKVIGKELNNFSSAERENLGEYFKKLVEEARRIFKNYLVANGYPHITDTEQMIGEVFADGLIHSAEDWIEAIEKYNFLKKGYDDMSSYDILSFIQTKFYPMVSDLHATMESELED